MRAKKFKGFMVLPAVLMSILLGLLGLSFLQIYSSHFSALSTNRKALQASQFAEAEADYLRNVDYANVTSAAHGKRTITGATGWQSSVTIGSETEVSGVKQRMATVNIYRNSTIATPDFSLQVPLSSAGAGSSEGGDNLPVGTILPYQGNISDIPEKWHLCDGTNNTPDLRNGEFLEASLTVKNRHSAGLPNITGIYSGSVTTGRSSTIVDKWDGSIHTIDHSGSGTTGLKYTAGNAYARFGHFEFDASKTNTTCAAIYRNDVTTVQPKSYTVLYIMKIKA